VVPSQDFCEVASFKMCKDLFRLRFRCFPLETGKNKEDGAFLYLLYAKL